MKLIRNSTLKLSIIIIFSLQISAKTPVIDYSVVWFIDNIKLLYTIEEVHKNFPDAYLIIQKNKIQIYETKYPKDGRDWTFNFYKFNDNTYLLSSFYYKTEGSLIAYNNVVKNYTKALKATAHKSKPGVIPLYTTFWETGSGETKTRLTISYDPKNKTIEQLLSLDLFALKRSDVLEIKKLILGK